VVLGLHTDWGELAPAVTGLLAQHRLRYWAACGEIDAVRRKPPGV